MKAAPDDAILLLMQSILQNLLGTLSSKHTPAQRFPSHPVLLVAYSTTSIFDRKRLVAMNKNVHEVHTTSAGHPLRQL